MINSCFAIKSFTAIAFGGGDIDFVAEFFNPAIVMVAFFQNLQCFGDYFSGVGIASCGKLGLNESAIPNSKP